MVNSSYNGNLKEKTNSNINNLSQILSDNVYINNLNIIEDNYLNAASPIKLNTLRISKETTIEIKSSYENINLSSFSLNNSNFSE